MGVGRERRYALGGGAIRVAGAAVLGYLAGTFPSADIATRSSRRPVGDLRAAGSGNPGATNAAAVLGPRWGLAVLLADVTKGAVAGVAGRRLAGPTGSYAAATTAIAGHIVPVWSRGRGGKGVATSAGAALAVFPAFFPVLLSVAGFGAIRTRSAERSMQWTALVWAGSSLWWWRQARSNGWGPPATAALPLSAITSSTLVLTKFRLARVSALTAAAHVTA